jgi:hypothetical protein
VRKLGHSISGSGFTVILVACQEETWLVFKTCEEWLIEEENPVHAEHSCIRHFVSKLAYLSDIFEKFNTFNPQVQFPGK